MIHHVLTEYQWDYIWCSSDETRVQITKEDREQYFKSYITPKYKIQYFDELSLHNIIHLWGVIYGNQENINKFLTHVFLFGKII